MQLRPPLSRMRCCVWGRGGQLRVEFTRTNAGWGLCKYLIKAYVFFVEILNRKMLTFLLIELALGIFLPLYVLFNKISRSAESKAPPPSHIVIVFHSNF